MWFHEFSLIIYLKNPSVCFSTIFNYPKSSSWFSSERTTNVKHFQRFELLILPVITDGSEIHYEELQFHAHWQIKEIPSPSLMSVCGKKYTENIRKIYRENKKKHWYIYMEATPLTNVYIRYFWLNNSWMASCYISSTGYFLCFSDSFHQCYKTSLEYLYTQG